MKKAKEYPTGDIYSRKKAKKDRRKNIDRRTLRRIETI